VMVPCNTSTNLWVIYIGRIS